MAQNGNISMEKVQPENVVVDLDSDNDTDDISVVKVIGATKRKLSIESNGVEPENKLQKNSTENDDSLNKKELANNSDTDKPTVVKQIKLNLAADKKPVDSETEPKPLLEKYWSVVRNDPSDFTGWTYLLQYVEQQNDVDSAVKVFDDFLSNYPYCYGYWRKYGDYFNKKGFKDKCEKVFERGVNVIPLSVDLWIHYTNYMKTEYGDREEDISDLYEKALSACGLDFKSDRLWDSYVTWKTEKNKLIEVTEIFDRWLKVPTQGCAAVMEKFKKHVNKNPPNAIVSSEDFFTLRNDVMKENESVTPNDCVLSADAPPGEEPPDMFDKLSESETKIMREMIISSRTAVHANTTKEVQLRQRFEEAIKRPYFHVKPLEQSQLQNWTDYINFELRKGQKDRIIVLFERCLIACALYEKYWIMYTQYLTSLFDSDPSLKDKVRQVFEFGCSIYHKDKIDLNLEWATFEEIHGNVEKCVELLEKIENKHSGRLCIMYRRINFERRRGDKMKVCSMYESYINDEKISPEYVQQLCKAYAFFCAKVLKDFPKAVKILEDAIEKYKKNTVYYLNLIDIYLSKDEINVQEIEDVFDAVFRIEDLPLDKKLLFSQRKAEFLLEFSDDCAKIQKAEEISREYLSEYRKCMKPSKKCS